MIPDTPFFKGVASDSERGLESLGNTEQFAADLKEEIAKWRKVVAAAGIQAN